MSFIHYLFVGDFARDEHGVRFARPGPGEPYRPVVVSRLTPGVIAPVVREVTGGATDTLPDDWSAWLDDGYVVCDLYTSNPAEIEFIARLADRTGCALFDRSGHSEFSLAEWTARTCGEPAHDPR